MLDQLRSVVIVLACVFVAGLLLVPTTARADVDKPTWKVGNYWVYKGDVLAIPMQDSTDADATMRLEVLGSESVEVEGTTYDAYHLEVEASSKMGIVTVTIPGNMWVRSSDLSILKVNLSANFMGLFLNFTTTAVTPLEMRWPLRADATWTVSGTVKGVINVTGFPDSIITQTLSGTIAVGASESISVQAGTFDTNPVTFTMADGNRSKSYWSADAGNYVQQKTYNQSGEETSSTELTSYGYEKPSAPSGGFLGLGTFLGLDSFVWIAAVAIALVVGISAVGVRRRRKRSEAPPPSMPSMPPSPGAPEEPGSPREPPSPPP